MAGTIDYNPKPVQLASPAIPVGVFRVDPVDSTNLTYVANVRCEQIQHKEGAVASTARFSYFLDIVAQANGWPMQFEQIFPLNAPPSPYIFRADDQIAVMAQLPDRMPAVQFKRTASPTKFYRWALIDRQDQYKVQEAGDTTQDAAALGSGPEDAVTYPNDDTSNALDEATAIRGRHEFPTLAGSVTIPELSLAYQVADRIQLVYGRNASLAANAGDTTESPTYPYVVGLTWDFSGERQSTHLELSDQRLSRDR